MNKNEDPYIMHLKSQLAYWKKIAMVNKKQLDHQKLASSIFYSFAIGVLNNDDNNDEKIANLQYVVEWLQDSEEILAGYNEVKK